MSNLRKRQAAKKIAGAAALTAAAPGGGGACDSERALLPLIAALAREIFLELHRDELGCLGQGGRVVAVLLGIFAGQGVRKCVGSGRSVLMRGVIGGRWLI